MRNPCRPNTPRQSRFRREKQPLLYDPEKGDFKPTKE